MIRVWLKIVMVQRRFYCNDKGGHGDDDIQKLDIERN